MGITKRYAIVKASVILALAGCAAAPPPPAPLSPEAASARVAAAWNAEDLDGLEALVAPSRRPRWPSWVPHLALALSGWRVTEVEASAEGVLGPGTRMVILHLRPREGGEGRRERIVLVEDGGRWWVADF